MTASIPVGNATSSEFKMHFLSRLRLKIRMHLTNGWHWVTAVKVAAHEAFDSIKRGRDC